MVKLTFSVAGWMFEHGVIRLQRTYEESCRTFYLSSEQAQTDWDEHERLVKAGEAVSFEADDCGNVEWDYGDHIGAVIAEAEAGLRLVTEAFTIALHHYWEKQVRRLMKVDKYVERDAFAWLRSQELVPQESAITNLRLSANCIKHDDGHLFKRRADMFDPDEVAVGMKTGWHDALRMQPHHLQEFFASVRQSGPKKESFFSAR